MRLEGLTALICGGASGLGEGTARLLAARGARVAVVDLNGEAAESLAGELGAGAAWFRADVTAEDELRAAIEGAVEALGELRLVVGCAGIALGERVVGREGAAELAPFEKVVGVNLIGMFNLLRLGAAAMSENARDEEGERGAVVMTASIAAFEGQTGQIAYSASKAGVAGMTLPAARDLASIGIRVCTIAPGLFDTPLLAALPQKAREGLGAGVPFPRRLGKALRVRAARRADRREPDAERRDDPPGRRAQDAAAVTSPTEVVLSNKVLGEPSNSQTGDQDPCHEP